MDNKVFKRLIYSNDTYIIHYASNGIYEYGSLAPKISCIAVWGTNNEVRRRFFIQDFLEGNSLEQAEKIILQRFADFLSENENIKFIHWGMNADGFGFRAINARCSDLGVNIREIPSENKIDLSEIISNIVGKRLSIKQVLMMNSCISEDFLSGKEEVDCYNNGQYENIFNSVKDKVIGFSCIIDRIINNDLRCEFDKRYKYEPPLSEEEKALRKDELKLRNEVLKNKIELLKEQNREAEKSHQRILEELKRKEEELLEEIEDMEVEDFYESEPEFWFFSPEHPIMSFFANIGNFFKK